MPSFSIKNKSDVESIVGQDNAQVTCKLLDILNSQDNSQDNSQAKRDLVEFCKNIFNERARAIAAYEKRPWLTIVEGNIGIGKTTLINKMCSENNIVWQHVPEPLLAWQAISYGDWSCFEQFYSEIGSSEPSGYIFLFEVIALVTRFMCLTHFFLREAAAGANKRLITERCFLTDRFVFAANLEHKFTEQEFAIYSDLVNAARDAFIKPNLDQVNVLAMSNHGTIDLCLERIRLRNRAGEELITHAYLENLEKFHTTYFDQWQDLIGARLERPDPTKTID